MTTVWIKHVAAFRKAHPGMDPKKVFGEAAKTFKKQSTKRSAKRSAKKRSTKRSGGDPVLATPYYR